jgi:phage terminase large subunit GpA-like protein
MVAMKGSQTALTTTAYTWLAHALAIEPASALIVMNSTTDAKHKCLESWKPMWEDSPGLQRYMPRNIREDWTRTYQLINSVPVYWTGANSAGALGSKPIRYLILDEVDRGSNKLMCLQAILEGKPYFNKKTGETIYPIPGFNIVGTANTKGQGTDDGKYMSAQILDDAFLERFAITVEQEYPNSKVEKKIIMKKMERVEKIDEDFADKLVSWAEIIRKTYMEGAIDELISTRRLEHIVNAYAMFGDRLKAINLCIARFNAETKMSFIDLYTKVDAGVAVPSAEQAEADAEEIAKGYIPGYL